MGSSTERYYKYWPRFKQVLMNVPCHIEAHVINVRHVLTYTSGPGPLISKSSGNLHEVWNCYSQVVCSYTEAQRGQGLGQDHTGSATEPETDSDFPTVTPILWPEDHLSACLCLTYWLNIIFPGHSCPYDYKFTNLVQWTERSMRDEPI